MSQKEKILLDYKEELIEKFPYISDRQMDKIIRVFAKYVTSYLGTRKSAIVFSKPGDSMYDIDTGFTITRNRFRKAVMATHFMYVKLLKKREVRKLNEIRNSVLLSVPESEYVLNINVVEALDAFDKPIRLENK